MLLSTMAAGIGSEYWDPRTIGAVAGAATPRAPPLCWRFMPEGSFLYCDVSLPVPIDQPFTYALPETLRHRVRPGSRLVVPFRAAQADRVILRCHDEPPSMAAREAFRLVDSEPVLDAELMALGRWISGYYCAPLGDVLRSMLPLAAEIRQGRSGL